MKIFLVEESWYWYRVWCSTAVPMLFWCELRFGVRGLTSGVCGLTARFFQNGFRCINHGRYILLFEIMKDRRYRDLQSKAKPIQISKHCQKCGVRFIRLTFSIYNPLAFEVTCIVMKPAMQL